MSNALFTEMREVGGSETYRPFSGLAVAAFVGGLLSPLALVSHVLWAVPALAIIAAVAALGKMRSSARQGAGMARCGLALAMAFLFGSIAYSWWEEYVVRTQAQRVADRWVEAMLSADTKLAHQLTLPIETPPAPMSLTPPAPPGGAKTGQPEAPSGVPPPSMGGMDRSQPPRHGGTDNLEEVYRDNAKLASALETYGKNEVVAKVAEIGHVKNGAVVSSQFVSQAADSRQQFVSFRYQLRYEEDGEEKTMSLSLTLSRRLEYAPNIAGWQVTAQQ